jgi:hypothetical protein
MKSPNVSSLTEGFFAADKPEPKGTGGGKAAGAEFARVLAETDGNGAATGSNRQKSRRDDGGAATASHAKATTGQAGNGGIDHGEQRVDRARAGVPDQEQRQDETLTDALTSEATEAAPVESQTPAVATFESHDHEDGSRWQPQAANLRARAEQPRAPRPEPKGAPIGQHAGPMPIAARAASDHEIAPAREGHAGAAVAVSAVDSPPAIKPGKVNAPTTVVAPGPAAAVVQAASSARTGGVATAAAPDSSARVDAKIPAAKAAAPATAEASPAIPTPRNQAPTVAGSIQGRASETTVAGAPSARSTAPSVAGPTTTSSSIATSTATPSGPRTSAPAPSVASQVAATSPVPTAAGPTASKASDAPIKATAAAAASVPTVSPAPAPVVASPTPSPVPVVVQGRDARANVAKYAGTADSSTTARPVSGERATVAGRTPRADVTPPTTTSAKPVHIVERVIPTANDAGPTLKTEPSTSVTAASDRTPGPRVNGASSKADVSRPAPAATESNPRDSKAQVATPARTPAPITPAASTPPVAKDQSQAAQSSASALENSIVAGGETVPSAGHFTFPTDAAPAKSEAAPVSSSSERAPSPRGTEAPAASKVGGAAGAAAVAKFAATASTETPRAPSKTTPDAFVAPGKSPEPRSSAAAPAAPQATVSDRTPVRAASPAAPAPAASVSPSVSSGARGPVAPVESRPATPVASTPATPSVTKAPAPASGTSAPASDSSAPASGAPAPVEAKPARIVHAHREVTPNVVDNNGIAATPAPASAPGASHAAPAARATTPVASSAKIATPVNPVGETSAAPGNAARAVTSDLQIATSASARAGSSVESAIASDRATGATAAPVPNRAHAHAPISHGAGARAAAPSEGRGNSSADGGDSQASREAQESRADRDRRISGVSSTTLQQAAAAAAASNAGSNPHEQARSDGNAPAPSLRVASRGPARDFSTALGSGDEALGEDGSAPTTGRRPAGHGRTEGAGTGTPDQFGLVTPVAPATAAQAQLQRPLVAHAGGEAGISDVMKASGGQAADAPVEGSPKARHEADRSVVPTLPQPTVEMPLQAPVPTNLAPTETRPVAPPAPSAAAEIVNQANEDPALSVAVMSHAAHLSIEGDNGRNLELHVRLRPEGADIRAAGDLAPMMQARANELSLALAAQGVTLGRFELGDGDRRGGREDAEAAEDAREDARSVGPRRVGRKSSDGESVARISDGRIHVKA